MRHVTAVLVHEGTVYAIEQEWDESGGTHEDSGIYYQWTDGNYGCDCNRLLFIAEQYGVEVPENPNDSYGFPPCGHSIELKALTIDGKTWDMEEERKKDEEFMRRGWETMRIRYPDLYAEYYGREAT